MEEFNLNMELSENDARQDKISLFIGNWDINATELMMSSFIISLGDQTRSHPTFHTIAFQQTNRVDFITRKKLKIFRSHQGRGYKENAPLFTGELVIKRERHNHYRLNLLIDINPTRFCVYQRTPIRNRNPKGMRTLSPSIVLFATQNRIQHGQGEDLEFTFGGSDNCLLTPSSKLNASQQFYLENFNRYLLSIISYIEDEIADFQQHDFIQRGVMEEFYSIRSIETYWDIPCPNPTVTLKQLENLIRTSVNRFDVNQYLSDKLTGSTFGLDDLTPCYTCYYRNGESLKLYAKTNKKIRLEVTYDFQKHKTLRSEWGNTPNSVAKLFEFISYCCEMSTTTANDFISALSRNSTENLIREKPLIEFITKIYSHTDTTSQANAILSMIASTGGIISSKAPKHLKSNLDRLVDKGILTKQSGRATRYIPQPRYLNASRKLID